jgi:NAD(P)-dependent dehydrogenase (short-subunit alcohol dehydrogenase family)
MKPDLTGRVALVTGAGRCIGRSVALSLAGAGATLFLTARSREQLEAVAAEIRDGGHQVEILCADVFSETDVDAVFSALHAAFGSLDILVNNAGFGVGGPLVSFPVESFDALMATNVRGVFLCCQQAMPLMVPTRSGYIINISSVVGFKG